MVNLFPFGKPKESKVLDPLEESARTLMRSESISIQQDDAKTLLKVSRQWLILHQYISNQQQEETEKTTIGFRGSEAK